MKRLLIYVVLATILFGVSVSPILSAFITIQFKDGTPRSEIDAVLAKYGMSSTLDYYDEAYWIKLTPKESDISLQELEELAAKITFENELRSSTSLIRWIAPLGGSMLQGKTTETATESEVRGLLEKIPKLAQFEIVLSKQTPPIDTQINFWKFLLQFRGLKQEQTINHATFVGFNNPVIFFQNLFNSVNPPKHPDALPKAY